MLYVKSALGHSGAKGSDKGYNVNVSSLCHFVGEKKKDEKYLLVILVLSVNVEVFLTSLYRKLW